MDESLRQTPQTPIARTKMTNVMKTRLYNFDPLRPLF